MSQSDCNELLGSLIDVVEDWLTSKGASVSFGKDTEDAAFIFGADYDHIADRFAEIIGISHNCVENTNEKI